MSTKEDQDLADAKVIQHRLDQMEGRAPIAEAQVGGEQELTAEQRAKLPYVAVMGMPCFLKDSSLVCVEKPYHIGYTNIPETLRHGRKEDRLYFTICEACHKLEDIQARIEAEMLRRLGG